MTRESQDPIETPSATGAESGSSGAPERMREAIAGVVEPVVAVHKCELVELEYRRESVGWVLRLYVEHIGHDPRHVIGGVGIDECARISRDVSMALDVADILQHAYHLEVSSPGLERPLSKPEHYRRFAGLRAKVRLELPIDAQPGRRNYRGEILGLVEAQPESIRFRDDEVGEVVFPSDRIARAHLVYEPAPRVKPGKAKQPKEKKTSAPKKGHAHSPAASALGETTPEASSRETAPRVSRGASENDR
jgi:ribosome maturation factor RimP